MFSRRGRRGRQALYSGTRSRDPPRANRRFAGENSAGAKPVAPVRHSFHPRPTSTTRHSSPLNQLIPSRAINWVTAGQRLDSSFRTCHDAVTRGPTGSPSCGLSSRPVSSRPGGSSRARFDFVAEAPRELCASTTATSRRHEHAGRTHCCRRPDTERLADFPSTSRAATAGHAGAAGYATLREIEGRLKSIRNIEKITNTMKIVASTKLTRAQRSMTESRKYGQTSNEVFESAETTAAEGEEKKSLIIVCSSDKGLCGGIHSGMSRKIRSLYATESPFDLVIVGEKCKAQLQRTNNKNIQLTFAGVGKDVPTFADAQAIADQIVMLPTEYTDVKILYNKFINAQSYEPTFIEAFSEEAIAQSRTFIC